MAVSPTDAAIVARWRVRLAVRKRLLAAAVARFESRAFIEARERQVAEAQRVIARHNGGPHVSPPVEPVLADSWGYHRGIHDGIDLIANWRDEVTAVCDGVIVDARASGWWGNGARPSSGHPISDGDGIVQLRCTISSGPFVPGLVFGYGHTERATVKVGQRVKAGQIIGHIGWANAPHIHFMANRGHERRPDGSYLGIGTHDPRPYLDWAKKHG